MTLASARIVCSQCAAPVSLTLALMINICPSIEAGPSRRSYVCLHEEQSCQGWWLLVLARDREEEFKPNLPFFLSSFLPFFPFFLSSIPQGGSLPPPLYPSWPLARESVSRSDVHGTYFFQSQGNKLLDGSISLSPLYPSMINDLHVSIATSPNLSFPRIRLLIKNSPSFGH